MLLFYKSLLGHSVLLFSLRDVSVELAPVLGFRSDEGVKGVGLDSGRRHDTFAFFWFFAGGWLLCRLFVVKIVRNWVLSTEFVVIKILSIIVLSFLLVFNRILVNSLRVIIKQFIITVQTISLRIQMKFLSLIYPTRFIIIHLICFFILSTFLSLSLPELKRININTLLIPEPCRVNQWIRIGCLILINQRSQRYLLMLLVANCKTACYLSTVHVCWYRLL